MVSKKKGGLAISGVEQPNAPLGWHPGHNSGVHHCKRVRPAKKLSLTSELFRSQQQLPGPRPPVCYQQQKTVTALRPDEALLLNRNPEKTRSQLQFYPLQRHKQL
ncbi:unnamed protein product [Arctogadus glacialis]